MVESYIALGSNLGDRENNLQRAVEMISRQMKLTRISSVYETEPMYKEDQSWFLNCVVSVETNLEARDLLERLQAIEREMGRQRAERYGPRNVDLDILFYGDQIVSEPGLEIPHPRITERLFVLVPLAEISPDLVHPVLKKQVAELVDALRMDKKVVKRTMQVFDLAALSPQQP